MQKIILVLFSLILAACGGAKIDTATEAQAAFEAYVQAINEGDTKTAAQVYDVVLGFHWIENGGLQYESATEAAASLRALSESGSASQMTINNLKVVKLADDAALLSSHFDFVMLSETGEEQFSFDGWMTVGMAKRESGWKISGGQTGPGKPH